ncbi:MAG: CoA-transferase, partial [Pseudolabrys sp.]
MAFKNKIVSADEAIAIVRDNDTVCISGFVGIGTPDELILALERRFIKKRHPSALTLM